MKISFNNNINNYSFNTNSNLYNTKNFKQPTFASATNTIEESTKKLIKKESVQKALKSKFFNNLLKTSMTNPGLYEAMLALLITCTARPLTVLATPGAKLEDKQYAAAQSIASGISGLAFAYIIFNPIKDAISKIFKDINNKNVQKTFRNFYDNPKNADIIRKLTDKKIIPDLQTFNSEYAKPDADIYKFMEDYFKGTKSKPGALADISNLLTSDDNVAKQNWSKLAEDFSERLKNEFNKVKFNDIAEHKKYLVHDSISFIKDGAYKISLSPGASNANFILNYSSKIILFPFIAAATIWAIPKIMKLVFPNHKKTKKADSLKQNVSMSANNNISKIQSQSTNKVFKNFNTKPALVNNSQVSFSGGFSLAPTKLYEKLYKKPLAKGLSKVFDELTFSRKWFSKKMNYLLQNDTVKKYGMEVLDRDETGKILKKADNNFYVSNLPNIAAVAGSCLYIFNTIKNKEIDPERKPALCTNMAVVAIFSLLASKGIEKVTKSFFDTFAKAHSNIMRNKINYNSMEAWNMARRMLVTTFAFRYLGPVIATPTADKLVKLFNTHKEHQNKMNSK